MATFSKEKLSGSTDGRGIKVVATASSGTTIHTAHATSLDEVWLYGYNSDTVSRLLTIQFGGTTSVDDDIKVTLPSQTGLTLVVSGLILTNSSVVRAYAAAANVVVLTGYINRITP
jgi:hypothetical protein